MNLIFQFAPVLTVVSLVATLCLLLAAWVLSIRAGFQSEKGSGLRLLLILPITNPIGLMVLLVRDPKAAWLSAVVYLMAILALPLLGTVAARSEGASLDAYLAQKKADGDAIDMKSLVPEPVAEEENVWGHPFFKLMADAARYGEEGQAARTQISSISKTSPYRSLARPDDPKGLRYVKREGDDFRSTSNTQHPLQWVHRYGVAILAAEAETGRVHEEPATWSELGELIRNHYQSAEQPTQLLEEAVSRPFDQFPYEWEKSFEMLLPHLAILKALSLGTTLRSQAASLVGEGDEAFRFLTLSLKLAMTGDDDFLISRLVQFAQTKIALGGIRVAQQFHQGTDEQWKAMERHLDDWDFLDLPATALRGERAMGHGAIASVADKRFNELQWAIRRFEDFGSSTAGSGSWIEESFQAVADILLTSTARAVVIKNWRQVLLAYEKTIANLTATAHKARSTAWNECDVPPLPGSLESYGLFAKLFLPATEKVFVKAVEAQHHVALAKVAIALERFYIANQAYPESLSDLVPAFLPSEPIDPMTRGAWTYRRLETKGFLLYSFGRDGEDDGGAFRAEPKASSDPVDDLSWFVDPAPPELPTYTTSSMAQNDTVLPSGL